MLCLWACAGGVAAAVAGGVAVGVAGEVAVGVAALQTGGLYVNVHATTVVDVVTDQDSGLVTPETGGAISTGTGDEAITVIFPPGIVSETIRISLTRELTPSAAFTQTVLRVLRVTALTPEGTVLPDVPLNGAYTIRFRYSDAQLAALRLTEDALQAFVLVNGQYVLIPPAVSLATTTVDPANNLVTVQTDTISEFVVGGAQAVRRVYLPIVVRATTSQ